MQHVSESLLTSSLKLSGILLTVEDKKTLCTQIGTGEAQKLKYTAYLFDRMRCIAALHEMLIMM